MKSTEVMILAEQQWHIRSINPVQEEEEKVVMDNRIGYNEGKM